MLLKDIQPGQLVYTSEMRDGELREVYYRRDFDRKILYDYDVPVLRYGLIQGDPEIEELDLPRYIRFRKEPYPSEADSRTVVHLIDSENPPRWYDIFTRLTQKE